MHNIANPSKITFKKSESKLRNPKQTWLLGWGAAHQQIMIKASIKTCIILQIHPK
jgi:hypothetical protein